MIFTFFALVNAAKAAEQTKEKATIKPSLVTCEGTKYSPTIDRMGKRDEPTTARMRTKFRILPSEYRAMCHSSPPTSERWAQGLETGPVRP